ncbi:MAG: glycosyltransferase family 4 protein [Chloroflexi bacterium]|nr:glycosyltransferase family 4 protein [Chloroflexota bacterium]
MKIALVSPYDFAYPGGVANHISCLERHLTARGHEVRVIAPASRAVPDFGDRFIPVGKPRPLPVSGSIARITISPWLASRVQAILDRERFDIIHLHEPLCPMLCTTVLRLARTPTVGTFHASGGKPWYELFTPIGKAFLNKWFKKLNGRIAVSEPARKYVHRYFPAEYTIIPNGVDPGHFCPEVPPVNHLSDGKLNILFVGRLEKRKGLAYLLEAYKEVKHQMPDSRLLVVGPGTRLHRKYQRRIADNGLKDVIFVGGVPYRELPCYYQTADIFCAPAIGRESFGIVLLEAMAVGKPIVATNIEGYATVLNHGVEGLLVPPRNARELSKALISLMADKAMRQQMATRGRTKALEYDWAHITQRVLDYYMKILNETPRHDKARQYS